MRIALRGALFGAVALIVAGAAAPALAEVPNLTAGDRAGPCRDPWLNYAYRTTVHRAPVGSGDKGECLIYLYAAGRWQNYDQLRDGVSQFVNTTANAGMVVQQLSGLFSFVNRVTGGRLNALIETTAGQVVDLQGAPRPKYHLLEVKKRVLLSAGTTIVVM